MDSQDPSAESGTEVGSDFWATRQYISPHAVIQGPVQFAGGCVVLAGASIIASSAHPIVIGPYCLVEEYAYISSSVSGDGVGDGGENNGSDLGDGVGSSSSLVIGACNHFGVRSTLRGVVSVGSGNRFMPFSAVSGGAVGDCSVVVPHVQVDADVPSRCVALHHPSATAVVADGGATHCLVPRDGSRSIAELPFIAAAISKTSGVGHVGGGGGHGGNQDAADGVVAVVMSADSKEQATTPQRPTTVAAAAVTPSPSSEAALLVQPWMDDLQTLWEKEICEEVRKKCRCYLQKATLLD